MNKLKYFFLICIMPAFCSWLATAYGIELPSSNAVNVILWSFVFFSAIVAADLWTRNRAC